MQAEPRPTTPLSRLLRRPGALAIVLTLVVAGVASGRPDARADSRPADPTSPATPTTVTADALPTTQIDGVAWTQLVVGDTVFVGGRFSNARPAGAAPGTNLTPRSNFLAYDVRTGELIPTIAPAFNAQVRTIAASPDGTRLYVGGDFTNVDGLRRDRLAAFELPSMRLIGTFLPPVAYHVMALAVSPDNQTLYVGGNFSAVGSQVRNRLAAFRTSDGALLSWAPNAQGGMVSAMVVSPDGRQVVVGGRFTSVNGSTNPGYGLASIDTTTGALTPWAANALIRNGRDNAGITSLSTDGVNVYGTGFSFSGTSGNLEGTFAASWSGGRIAWVADCHGDHYGVHAQNGVVYTVSHAHHCGNFGGFPETTPRSYHRALAFSSAATGVVGRNTEGSYYNFEGNPAPSELLWYPDLDQGTFTGQNQGPWNVAGNGTYIVLGGEFTQVNFRAQQGLVRFAVAEAAPNREGPRVFQNTWNNPTATSTFAGTVRVSIPANYDRDNATLTYRLERDGVRVAETTAVSSFYRRPTVSLLDTTATPGSRPTYRVVAVDPFGNAAPSNTVTVTVSSTGNRSAYTDAVLTTPGLTNYWRMGETSGAFADLVGNRPLTLTGSASRGVTGVVPNDNDRAVTLNGGYTYTNASAAAPQTFSVEAWFRTSNTGGGKILGYGSSRTGNSSSYDRHFYIGNDGRLRFGVNPGGVRVVTSPTSLLDNRWHHAVATVGNGVLSLYVDGQLVDQLTGVAGGETINGYWRVGGDNLSGWPNRPSRTTLLGTIDEVAVYDGVLSADAVARHYEAGTTGAAPNTRPVAAFTATATPLTVAVDASTSTDPDGTITGYAWDFGDGSTGTGVTASRTYAAPGTYTVTLTVTDDRGATGTTTQQVEVPDVAPNQAPTAAFTTSPLTLGVAVDASTSTDPDGTITGYAWDFGDGSTGTGVTASRTYAAPGAYTVTLTVTDDRGATGTTTQQVEVTDVAVPPQPFATDAFEREVTGGLGTADSGGPWALAGSTTNFAVGGGQAQLRMNAAGQGVSAFLPGTSTDTEVRATVAVDKLASPGSVFTSVVGRRVGTADYRAKVRFATNGTVQAIITRVAGGETDLVGLTVPGLTVAPGEPVQVRFQVTGTSPTTLRLKVWRAGTPEPADWQLSTTDATAALQAGGGVGFVTYLSSSATNAPVIARFDDLWAGPTA